MDPNALLDYALFHLTPTRTRCDLLVFSGGKSEKLASGLVEPFVSHLKFAKDQIPKGGYSITLRPPTSNASWFTKSTFRRFVRFVSTPEVLERFARLEKEIMQIESSVQPNECANGNAAGQADEGTLSTADGIIKKPTNSLKLKGGTDETVQEENSKIRLQRLLETRKAILRKEQAMAYARALAAGFGLDDIDDLVFFADAFGASRLREACTDFVDLCKKKHTDGLWMDELAAMQACPPPDLSFMGTSGIILSCDSTASYQNFQSNGRLASNGSLDVSSDSTAGQANSDSNKESNLSASDQVSPAPANVQAQMPWPNQIPPYMFNFQGPVQQMHPYQAYPFPGMQHVPPFYPANMHWPQNMDETGLGLTREPDHRRPQRSSSRKKEKSPNTEGPETSEEDDQTESSDSHTGNESEVTDRQSKEQPYKKKNRKKSSKTVVIRNINYITSNRRNEENDSSSAEDELVDEDSIKMQVEDAVGSLEKHHKPSSKNHKKSSGNKKLGNGSNGSYNQDLETDSVTITSEGGKGNENWDAFQNLLMSEKELTTTSLENHQPLDVLDEHFKINSSIDSVKSENFHYVDFDSEKVQRRRTFETDSFVATERNEVNEGRVNHLEDFGNGETVLANMKRGDLAEETLLFPHKLEESWSMHAGRLSDYGMESSRIKNGMGEDWFIVNHSGISESQDATIKQTMFDGGYAVSSDGARIAIETSNKIVPVDDSFMVQAHTSVGDQSDSHWKTDITMDLDLVAANQPENGTADGSHRKIGVSGVHEPDDLCVVLTRNPGFECSGMSWSPEMDYGNEVSFTEALKKSPVIDTKDQIEEKPPVETKSTDAKNTVVPVTTNSAKQSRSKVLQGSVAKSMPNFISQSKKSIPTSRPMIQKSKLVKEEEARKRAEELLIERQKRIAERTAVRGSTPAASKKVPAGSKLNSHKSGVTKSSKNHLVPGQTKQNGGSPASKV